MRSIDPVTDAARSEPRISRRAELRRFGWVVGAAFTALGGVFLWRDNALGPSVLAIGVVLGLLGSAAPGLLAPVEQAWMTLARVLSVVMTRVILSLCFALLITPLGLLRRLIKRDPLELKRDRSRASYWIPVAGERPSQRPDRPY